MRAMFRRARTWAMISAAGGSMFALESCDATVRDTVLNGVGTAATTLSTTFIDATIQSLIAEEEEATSTVRVFDKFDQPIFA